MPENRSLFRAVLRRLTFLLACLLGAWGGIASAAVTYQAAGTAVSGTIAAGLSVPWPAHAVGDIALLFVESTGGQPVTLGIANGFVEVTGSPQATGTGTNGTRLTVFWARATSAAMAAPVLGAPSDHVYARIVTYRGVIASGDPFDGIAGGVKAAASTGVSLDSVTTTVANTRIVQAVARDNDNAAAAFSAQANANLTGIAEQLDAGTANGNGGGLGVWSGVMATAGATGVTTATVTSSINAFITLALKPQPAAPAYQAAGGAVNNATSVSPAWPAHAVGDIALLFVESGGGEAVTLAVANGFTPVPNSPQATGAGTAGTRLTVFWARATSTTMAAPTVTVPAVANSHIYARIITYRNVVSAGNPWDVTGGGVKTPASTSVSVSGVTTTVPYARVVQAAARDTDANGVAFSAETNPNLTGIAERSDGGTNRGSGGGFAVWDGVKASAGAIGNTTATVTNSINAFLTVALAPTTPAAPVYRALGGAATTGLNWPAHAVDDIALLFVESTGGQPVTLAAANGFAPVANSPQATGAGTAGTQLTVFWARATSAAMVGPVLSGTSDHVYARILTYRGVANSGNPWDVTGGGVDTSNPPNSVTLTGVTTTVPNTRVVQAVSRDNDNAGAAFSAETNANLTGIAERHDAGTTTGNGGGFGVWDGAKATAGATGNTTANVTNSINAFLTIALRPFVAVDHYELSLPTASISCLPTTLTVTACADASSPCTNPATTVSGQTATLGTSAGTLGTTTVAFNSSGLATTTLSYPAAANGAGATVTLSGESSPATNPRQCCPDGTSCVVANSCATTFSTAGFIFSASAGGGTATIPAQVAGTSSAQYYLRAVRTSTATQACESAMAGANTVNFAYECNNPATCSASNLMSVNGGSPTTIARNNNGSVSSYTPVNMTFDANGNAPFTFNFADVGQATLHVAKTVNAAPLAGASNPFVVKPGGFVLLAIQQTALPNLANPAAADAAGAKFVKAGEAFSVTVTATTSDGLAATPNYGKEASAEGVTLTASLVAPASGASPALQNPTAFGTFTNGVATGTTFSWAEVGIITLTPSVGDGNYLGAGDVAGTASGNVGRFYPDHFALAPEASGSLIDRAGINTGITESCASPFTYLGEDFKTRFVLTAENAANDITQNYTGSFAKLGLTTWGNYAFSASGLPAGSTLGVGDTAPSGTWSDGTAQVTAYHKASRPAAPVSPGAGVTLSALPVDGDGVTLSTAALVHDGSTDLRYGRLRLSNVYGYASPLLMPVETQYWTGVSWARNTGDNCTPLAIGNILLNPTGWTPTAPGTLSAGTGNISLAPTGPGSVTACADLGSDNGVSCSAASANLPWLQSRWPGGSGYDNDPSATATFGIFSPEGRKGVFNRELY